MKLNKDEMKKVLGGGISEPRCETTCWDGSILVINCPWQQCRTIPGKAVICGEAVQNCPPYI